MSGWQKRMEERGKGESSFNIEGLLIKLMDLIHYIPHFLPLISVTTGLQRFSEQPKYTEVNPNQDALLVCKVIDRRGTCSWQKDNKPVGMYPKKYEWASGTSNAMGMQSHSGDCSIWIRAATLEFDDG